MGAIRKGYAKGTSLDLRSLQKLTHTPNVIADPCRHQDQQHRFSALRALNRPRPSHDMMKMEQLGLAAPTFTQPPCRKRLPLSPI